MGDCYKMKASTTRRGGGMAHSLLFVWLAYALLSPTLAYSFALEDAVGDVASTQWPLPLQQLEEGELDLQHVMVSTEETGAVLFDLQFAGNLSNLHQAPLGFSVPLVQIYLHPAPPGSWRIYVPPGASREPLSNPNIQLSDQYYWEHMMEITGYGSRLFAADALPEDVTLDTALVNNQTIRIQVPAQAIGQPHDDWSYTILVGALFNGTAPSSVHPARFWPVQEDASEHSFGGGDDGTWDPNVLDLFTMPHAAWTREHMLYTYCASPAQRATVHPVGAHMPP